MPLRETDTDKSTMARNYNPVLEVGQRTQSTHGFTLLDMSTRPYEAFDLTDAASVEMTVEHAYWGETTVESAPVTIPEETANEGYVEYQFSREETRYYGTHYVQFAIEWSDGSSDLVPPEGSDWEIHVGRRLPRSSPLRSARAVFDEASIGTLETRDLSVFNRIPTFTVGDLDATAITGEVTDGNRLTGFGGGFVWDNGQLSVAIDDFGTVEGLTLPVTQNIPLAGYDLEGPGRAGTPTNPLAEAHAESGYLEGLNDTIRYVTEDITATEFNAIVDSLSSDGDGSGGLIVCDSDITISVESDSVWVKSDVFVDFNWATVTAPNGLDANYPANGLVGFDARTATENAHIRRVKIDGNATNNLGYSSRQGRHGINLSWSHWDGSSTVHSRPKGCSAKEFIVTDTISSSVGLAAEDSTVADGIVSDSADDHFVYASNAIDCTVRNIRCSGSGRGEAITVGDSSGTAECYGNLIEDIRLRDLVHDGPTANDLQKAIGVRGGTNVHDNTLRDITIDAPDVAHTTNIRIEAPTTLENITWTGEQAPTEDLIAVMESGAGSTLRNIDIEITGGDTSTKFNVLNIIGADGVTIEGLDISQTGAANVPYRGFRLVDGGGTLDDVLISNAQVDAPADQHYQIIGNGSGGVQRLGLQNVVFVGEVNKYVTGSITYASGTMLPQDVRQIENPFEGYEAYHDGAGSLSSGHCVYDSSEWVSSGPNVLDRSGSDIGDTGVTLSGDGSPRVRIEADDVSAGRLYLRVNGGGGTTKSTLLDVGAGSIRTQTTDEAETNGVLLCDADGLSGQWTVSLGRGGRPSISGSGSVGRNSGEVLMAGAVDNNNQSGINQVEIIAESGTTVSVYGEVRLVSD